MQVGTIRKIVNILFILINSIGGTRRKRLEIKRLKNVTAFVCNFLGDAYNYVRKNIYM
jgi:hypothetical protein